MKVSLNQSQASVLWRAAGALPPQARAAFFAAVDAKLVGIRSPLTDDDVSAAIGGALADNPTTASLCNEGS